MVGERKLCLVRVYIYVCMYLCGHDRYYVWFGQLDGCMYVQIVSSGQVAGYDGRYILGYV